MRKRTTAAIGATAVLVLVGASCSDDGNVFNLEVGSCFQEPGNSFEVADVETVDCEDPHFAEVYHTEDIDGDDFPGNASVATSRDEICSSSFEDFTGVAFEIEANFDIYSLVPTEESWESGDREVACSITKLGGGQLTGSAEGEGEPFEAGAPTGAPTGAPPGEPDEPPALADPELASLADECFNGSGTACDDLFFATDIGSPEEQYGNTCGGRFDGSPGLCSTAIGE